MIATPTRRGILRAFAGLIAAPAIVRAGSLMPVRELLGLRESFDDRLAALYRDQFIAAFESRQSLLLEQVNEETIIHGRPYFIVGG